jgi:transposase
VVAALLPAPCGPKPGKGKLAPHHSFLIELIDQDPDIMLHELRGSLEAAHGLRVHHSAIGYALDRLGYTFKKRSLIADERRKARVRQARADWIKHRLPAMRKVPERLVLSTKLP